jgi:uncharacterized membrane protein (UPF0127 family)
MTWLVTEGRVLASAETATTRAARRRGLLGRNGVEGALVLPRCRWVHTVGMRFPIDVIYLDRDGVVVKTQRLKRNRVAIPVFAARTVIEAETGALGRWDLHAGDVVELRE